MPTNSFLPEEIILNILKRLPWQSLKRFQCVCKQWNHLIKTPSFIQNHLHHSHQNPSLVVGPHFSKRGFYLLSCGQNMQFHDLHIPPLLRSLKRLAIEGSCNGLLFLVHREKYHAYPLLWNPATADVTKIKTSLDYFSHGATFGFWFCPITNDYKIVRIFRILMILFHNKVYGVEIYSLKAGFWRHVRLDSIEGVTFYGQSVTANGVIFWRGIKHIGIGQKINVIVSFDIVTEEFTVIPLPHTNDSHQLLVYDDKLALISYDKNSDSQSFPLYFRVMEEGGVWGLSEKYIGSFGSKLLPMTIWRNHIVSVDSGMENEKHLCLIDVSTNECKRFDIPKFKHGCGFGVNVFNYVERLVPVGGDFQN